MDGCLATAVRFLTTHTDLFYCRLTVHRADMTHITLLWTRSAAVGHTSHRPTEW